MVAKRLQLEKWSRCGLLDLIDGTTTSNDVGKEYRPKPMNTMKQVLSELAASDVPVLLIGEPGVGKHFVARQIHEAAPWRNAPFLQCDCRQFDEAKIKEAFGGNGNREPNPSTVY